jgi:signal transduction histidine kinase
MKITDVKYQLFTSEFSLKYSRKPVLIFLVALSLTIIMTLYTKNNEEEIAYHDFILTCNDIKTRLEARLETHAQLLRSGAAFFASSDTVTQEEWKKYIQNEKINKNLPGIQGIGYSVIIPKERLEKHIQFIRDKGFPDYTVYPPGDREIYTSIIYLEPFSGRNLRAFGYDMFSEPIRRQAMELSRDSDVAMLSGKVILVQETDEDVQAGTLMYVPVYSNGMSVNTLEERRKAIKGWVYSPYRMNDLTSGILGNINFPEQKQIQMKIYDNNTISDVALLYASNNCEKKTSDKTGSSLFLELPVEFNGKIWILQFATNKEKLLPLHGEVLIVLIVGIAISVLLFALSLSLINTKKRSQQIQLLNNQLEKVNIDKDRFISILAHDLKSPFCSLLGFSELLASNFRDYNTNEAEEHINIINKAAKSIYSLLEDLLLWAKTQSGSLPFEPECISFQEAFNEVVEGITFYAESKSISINNKSKEDTNIFADKNMLFTILRNLLSNAIKFTNRGGKIDVFVESSDLQATVTVSDNGIGISPDTASKLFDISLIHTSEGTENEKGTGLGLLLCKELVENHKGRIWVESTPGKGSDFKFTMQKCYL